MTGPSWYRPGAFRLDDPARLGELIRRITFATLVSNGPDGPEASHLPMMLDPNRGALGTLRGHLARANGHWQALEAATALVIFHGPEHYVSPAWYPTKAATGKVVPTWNYVVVHARGRVRTFDGAEPLRTLVEDLTRHMEAARAEPWAVDDAPADYVAAMVSGIVGVEVELTALHGKLKLGQNRTAADRAGLAAGLAAERPDVLADLQTLLDDQTAS